MNSVQKEIQNIHFVYTCVETQEAAQVLATSGVEAHLALCANIFSQGTSVYWWQGSVNRGGEVYLFFKTTADRLEALCAHIRRHHPYTTPFIASSTWEAGLEVQNWLHQWLSETSPERLTT